MKVRAIDAFPELAEVPAHPVTATIRRGIDEIWEKERESAAAPLGDSQVLSYQEERDGCMVCTFVPYRRWVAQLRAPELREVLRIRPMTVSAVLRARDGIVLGKRAEGLLGVPGQWEFAPSGRIDARARVGARRVSAQAQLYHELEAFRVLPRKVRSLRPLAIATSDDAESIELVFAVEADVGAADLVAGHLNDRREYESVRCVQPVGLAEAVSALGSDMLPLGHALLPILADANGPETPVVSRQWGIRGSSAHVATATPHASEVAPVHQAPETRARSQA